jgi:glycosyltransferase involved in cell wall biosynthesis
MGSNMWQVHVLSFEGPDAYARAGGIASRVTGLISALAGAACDTHLWFVGDPALPGEEPQAGATLHRWSQWISRYYTGGVYAGEEDKRRDYVTSLPPYLVDRFILPHLSDPAHRVAVMAEEWQTSHAVLHLDWLLTRAGVRDRVALLWNANNTFGFDRVDWPRLAQACTITTVSRYMRHRMWNLGVDPLVIANGVPPEVLQRPSGVAIRKLRHRAGNRPIIAKVARWDPDKRWLLAVDTIAELKRQGRHPLFVVRGGVEGHGAEVAARAAAQGLRITVQPLLAPGAEGLTYAVQAAGEADMLLLASPLDREASQLLFAASAAVLANSGHEPFGLVGLEAMAAGGVVCVGGTGEDYVVPGWNALVLQTMDPGEFIREFTRLRAHPDQGRTLRRNAATTAARFAWAEIVRRTLLPLVATRVRPSEIIRTVESAVPIPVVHERSPEPRVGRVAPSPLLGTPALSASAHRSDS